MRTKFLPIRCRAIAGVMIFAFALRAVANPTGMTVISGTANAQSSGAQLSINTSPIALLNWQNFNIAAGEKTIFNQPSATSLVINQINDKNPSQIWGTLQANGVVVLMNSAGFYFGPNSFVSAAGLTVSTANCVPPQNTGGTWEFNGPPPLASIVNYGSIKVGNGGSAFLIADKIENHGDIEAPGGSIGFAAGQTVTLSERPDGRGMSMAVTLPQGSVNNYGNLVADAGTIALNAKVVNQDGFIQANSVRNQNGVIELVAADALSLGAKSQISANGDNFAGGSAGGAVTLKSGNCFNDVTGSEISVTGGADGGNGGTVEVSAVKMSSLHTRMDGTAHHGARGGQLLLDPDYIILDSYGGDSAGSGTVAVDDNVGGTLDLNVNSAFTGFSQITLQAKYDITLADYTSWSLSDSTGWSAGKLILEAGGNIFFGNGASIYDANSWSIEMYAGVNNFASKTIVPGTGTIAVDSNDSFNPSYIKTATGSISLVAGQDITIGCGYVTTTAGGSISAHALRGSINTGTYAQGYYFDTSGSSGALSDAYNLADGLGGISTAAGGDVILTARGNVTSYLPGSNDSGDALTAGAGAYGNQSGQSGNVTVVAGGNVTGHYLVANGIGSIYAGVTFDASGNPIKDGSGNYVLGGAGSAGTSSSKPNLALSLISGGWNVAAAINIYLQEVRNPNGVFDTGAGAAWNHYFDYAPDDYVNLTAGNLVQLGAPTSTLPRDGSDGLNVPSIYPSILKVAAGAGGIVLGTPGSGNSLILFPSPLGGLTINDNGSLTGHLSDDPLSPQFFYLIVSDRSLTKKRYTSTGNFNPTTSNFGLNDHATTPVHSNSEQPVELNILGDMNLTVLGAPEAAKINVVGNMNNCGFQGINLAANDQTAISVGQAAKDNLLANPFFSGSLNSATVGGDIIDRSAFTSVNLNSVPGAQAPELAYLSQSLSSDISAATLLNSLYYNPSTQVLTYQNINGKTLAQVLSLLQKLPVQKTDSAGNLLWNDPLDPIPNDPVITYVSVLNQSTADALTSAYKALGGLPQNASSSGFFIGGGGQFNISARNIDLGTSAGIVSKGVGLYGSGNNYPLASLFGNGGIFQNGASINIATTGNLDLFSSSIASLNGGDIAINAGGHVYTGSPDFTVTSLGIRGIYTSGQGDISVIANGDINVNGSRIASYDGGNLTVESMAGNIDAGTGASFPVTVQGYYENPLTHIVYQSSPQIPFSGIVALTFPPRNGLYPAPTATLGNILIEAPHGNVTANVSGILQLALNNLNYTTALVTVLAGYELQDGSGHLVDAAHQTGANLVEVTGGENINAGGSGVIASNARLDASGDINGFVFARNNIDISAQQNISVTALGMGNVTVSSAAGTISGTIIGVGGVSASGSSIDASLVSANVTGSTSGQSGLGSGGAANSTANAASASDEVAKATKKSGDTGEDDLLKKKKGIALAQKVSRVTVLLPAKN